MKPYLASTALLISLILSGCNHSSSSSSSTSSSSGAHSNDAIYQGAWQADAYGRVYRIDWNGDAYDITTYLFTQQQCLISEQESDMTEEELAAITKIAADGSYIEFTESRLIPGAIYTRQTAIPSACQTTLPQIYGSDNYVFNPEDDFNFFWNYFDEYYLNFELSGTNWAMLYEEFYPLAIAAENEAELFALLADMIEPLEDSHVYVGLNPNGEDLEDAEDFRNVSAKPTIIDKLAEEFLTKEALTPPLSERQEDALEEYQNERLDGIVATLKVPADDSTIKSALGSFLWYITDDNMGYLLITDMSEFSDDDSDGQTDFELATQLMKVIMADLIRVDGLIIDIRLNQGGDDLVSHAIAKHFFTDEVLVYRKQARLNDSRTPLRDVYIKPANTLNFTGPIALLTSESTASAAEIFTLIMRERPNTTLIGEATAGSLSDVLEGRVSSPIFFGLSNEWYLTPNGTWFERQGIPVDIDVPFPSKEDQDEALTTALAHLREQ